MTTPSRPPAKKPSPHLAPHDELIGLLREIDSDGECLTEWEVGFIAQLIDRRVKRFSPAQAKQIRRIHQERVS